MVAAMTVVAVAFSSGALAAGGTTVYDATLSPLPGNLPSEAFQATQTGQFGDQVPLAGTARRLNSVTVTMSSWACQSGGGATCVTTPGSTFSMPITFNVYNVGGDGQTVGSLIATRTQTFSIPFRPSSDAVHCVDNTAWYDGPQGCFHGLANNITFDFSSSNVLLPNKVIYGVQYNTSGYGPNPYGYSTACAIAGNCPYDSLNVALSSQATVGSEVFPGELYQDSQTSSMYCDNGAGGIGNFRLDSPGYPTCWAGYVPAVQITAGSSGNQTCNGTLGATTIDGDLTVANGTTCFLNGTTVTHDVKVQSGAHLYATGANVGHDLTFNGAGTSSVCGSTVGHDLAAQTSTGPITIGGGSCGGNSVGHDLTVQNNTGGVRVDNNTVAHNLTVINNKGGADISSNSATYNATCSNTPQTGSGNSAGGTNSCP
jgi:hypothetical protein